MAKRTESTRDGIKLDGIMRAEHGRLKRRMEQAARKSTRERDRVFKEIETAAAASRARVVARRQSVPQIAFPPELPISGRREEIAAAIDA
ncbi:MAG: hypothetical protein MJA83_13085, partial [Gammaproteobacteria bacterium]|nr:hypothetical protein [Gammaproteobacteria bacterium]